MIKKIAFFLLMAAGVIVTSCKNDSEDDLIPDVPDTPQNYTGVVLNEICGKSADGDWIELYNNADEKVLLDGCILIKTDETGSSKTIYTFPRQTEIQPNGYLVIYGKDSQTPAFTDGISDTKAVGLELQSPAKSSIDKFDRDTNVGKDNAHPEGGSYARLPNGTGAWAVTATATLGAENKAGEVPSPEPSGDITGVVLNEICGLSDEEDSDDWIELYNTTDHAIVLDGAKIMKDEKDTMHTFTGGTTIEAGGYLVLSSAKKELAKGISNKKEVALDLQTSDGTSVDSFDRDKDLGTETKHEVGQSYARIPNGTGAWKVATATRGKAN